MPVEDSSVNSPFGNRATQIGSGAIPFSLPCVVSIHQSQVTIKENLKWGEEFF